MRAFILAGGFATRLWPLTEHRAKPLLPLAGEPILSRITRALPQNLCVTVSTNDVFADAFHTWMQAEKPPHCTLHIEHTRNDSEKLGALGAVAQWVTQEHVDDDLLLLTGDNVFPFSFSSFLQAFDGKAALVAVHDIGSLERAKEFGTVACDGNSKRIVAFEEKPVSPCSTLVSTGCSILPKVTLPTLCTFAAGHPDNIGGIFEELLRQGHPLEAFRFAEPWFDIGSFDAYLAATRSLVGNALIKAENARMEEVHTEGSVVIGKGSVVRTSTLIDTVVFKNCSIENCTLTSCVIDDGCVLKGVDLDRKMLRRGTVLELP
jgi:glucose-1-phosphate thymidylyltransferase